MKTPAGRGAAGALALLLPLASFQACVSVDTRERRAISPSSVDAKRLAPMLQKTAAGGLRVDSLIYKPRLLPLGAFLRKLAKLDLKAAPKAFSLGYRPSNADDAALKTLLKHGWIPVLVAARNEGTAPVDARALRLSLRDAAVSLSPVAGADLPEEFKELSPAALAADTYNVGAVVVLSAVFLAALAALVYASRAGGADLGGLLNTSGEAYGDGGQVLFPLRKEARIDYNGLLFTPRLLAPGESARGIVFFKAKGVDWSALTLEAALP